MEPYIDIRDDNAKDNAPLANGLQELFNFKASVRIHGCFRLETVFNCQSVTKLFVNENCTMVSSSRNAGGTTLDWAVLRLHETGQPPHGYCHFFVNGQYFNFSVVSYSVPAAEAQIKIITNALKPFLYDTMGQDSPYVHVDFYQMTGNGPNETNQQLLCPSWPEVMENYSSSVVKSMASLCENKEPWTAGKLLIINGPPGCGKTYFIRSLIRAWRNILQATVVLDPEEFSRNPLYYFGVTSQEPTPLDNDEQITYPAGSAGTGVIAKVKPRLLIMEDCADLIMSESRTAHYDKVGKLLNMTDGLLGQGRNDIFLISFNEEIKDIDPAFRRPGRLLMSLEIPKLSEVDAIVWLAKHGYNDKLSDGPRPRSLAELYSKVGNIDSKIVSSEAGKPKRSKVGF